MEDSGIVYDYLFFHHVLHLRDFMLMLYLFSLVNIFLLDSQELVSGGRVEFP